jgi:uncharacterized peroxidase-related enzyme
MAWIQTVEPSAAEGELAEMYAAIASARGGVAAVHRAQSLNPRALQAHLELYKAIVFQRSTLDRRQRERIAVVVSSANRCAYCVAHHGEALRNLGEPADVVAALAAGEVPQNLTAPDKLLVEWARRGALDPAESTEQDVRTLREASLNDRAILDAALTVAYFSFVNRLVLLLGVDLESDYARTCGDLSG